MAMMMIVSGHAWSGDSHVDASMVVVPQVLGVVVDWAGDSRSHIPVNSPLGIGGSRQ